MSTLTVISDPIKAERRDYVLRDGETLANALVRLWPTGLSGAWRIYRDLVHEDNEIAALELPYTVVLHGEAYLIVRDMAGPAFGAFFFKVVAAVVLSGVAASLQSQRRRAPETADTLSPNNALAAQSNLLRPGGRVPDILGRVRSFPDLLANPVDVYTETQQTIAQLFVVGVGAYEITDAKLGETPLSGIPTAQLLRYLPGEPVPSFFAMRSSPEVQGVSLLSEDTSDVPSTPGVNFNAAAHTLSSPTQILVGPNRPITISGSFFNNGVRWVTTIPPTTQTTGPFVYGLEGPVVDEINANPQIAVASLAVAVSGVKHAFFGKASGGHEEDVTFQFFFVKDGSVRAGQLIELTTPGYRWVGTMTDYSLSHFGRPPIPMGHLKMQDLNTTPVRFPSLSRKNFTLTCYDAAPSTGGTPPPDGITNAFTPWYAVPMDDPTEVWIDIEFPQGLAWYDHGTRRVLHVQVTAQFRREGSTAPQASVSWDFYYGTAAPLRFTKRVPLASLLAGGLPAGSGAINVRLQRPTPFQSDSSNNQYVQETRWARLAAVRALPETVYPNATVCVFTIANTRSATAMGETSVNMIATRILPTWTGSAWSAPAPTQKWADNFVARCKAADGAYRSDAQLDLAGIYAIQATLDSLDGGQQGEIGLTLDVMQDIDTELAQIADVARSVVYRVGRKIFASRDQANATTLALFNARTKSPDAETVAVRMTGDADNDCVIVSWIDHRIGWKPREFTYPDVEIALNPLRVGPVCSNWPQAYRRALYEWNRLKYRREQFSCAVTEDGRICRPGDVVNVADDTANLATFAGEVLEVAAGLLTLDRNVAFLAGSSHTLLVRDLAGQLIDRIPCTAVPGAPNQVQLGRAPSVPLKGRDTTRGTLFAFFPDAAANVRPWLITGVQLNGPYVQLIAANYTPKVYAGDAVPVPPLPGLPETPVAEGTPL